jgi:hypothetical protein
MIPVEATRTSSGATWMDRATSRAISSASRCPFGPVQALALPLFATIARAWPRAVTSWL